MQQAREYIRERELPDKRGGGGNKTLRRKISRRTLRERNGMVCHFV